LFSSDYGALDYAATLDESEFSLINSRHPHEESIFPCFVCDIFSKISFCRNGAGNRWLFDGHDAQTGIGSGG
jgi:hypothetical protein